MADIFELFKKISSENTASREPITHVIVGLGNPGAQYLHTRHNAGFLAIDHICNKYGARVNKSAHKGLVGEATIAGKRVLLVKPQTFMNLSGECVRAALDYYKISPDNLIVIYDDISFDPGIIRIRKKGSAGGHNGIKSIIKELSSDNFPRIKIGVGNNPPHFELFDWVLGKIPKEDHEKIFSALSSAADALPLILNGDIDKAMCKFN
jgi:PTH1 family peptidyl-tRNA hydrolase